MRDAGCDVSRLTEPTTNPTRCSILPGILFRISSPQFTTISQVGCVANVLIRKSTSQFDNDNDVSTGIKSNSSLRDSTLEQVEAGGIPILFPVLICIKRFVSLSNTRPLLS
jgi:hypothetical protein